MNKLFSVVAPIVGGALVGLAAAPGVMAHGSGHSTLLVLAGGIFTIALAVYIRD
jgi:hypothetical protein